jgi:hypothetical protein
MGAWDATHGHEPLAAELTEAGLAAAVAAVAGTASSAATTPAVSNRAFLDKTRQAQVLSITVPSGSGLVPLRTTQFNNV